MGKLSKIFFLAFLVRLIVIILAMRYNFIQTWEYEIIANNILSGLGYRFQHLGTTHYAFGPPLYTWLSVLVYYFTGHSRIALLLIQAILSSIACVLIFQIGKEIFEERIGLLASLMVVFHPGIALYVSKLHSFNIDMPLFTLIFFILLKAKDKMSIAYFLLLGIIFGLSLLARATIFLFIPVAFILLLFKSDRKRRLLNYLVLVFLIALLIISPWLIRNYKIFGRFLFIQKSGEVFWRGNNANASGTSFTLDGRDMLGSMPGDFQERLRNLTEIEQDGLFWADAFGFIKSHPFKFVSLTLKKFYYFWWFTPHTGIEYPKLYTYIYVILYAIAFLLGIIGIASALNSKIEKIRVGTELLLSLFLTVSLTQSFFYIEGRHRWTLEPLLLILTANGLMLLKDKLKAC